MPLACRRVERVRSSNWLIFFPTLSELAGLPLPGNLQGKSLVPVVKDHTSTVKPAALSFNKGFSLRTSDWHYMRYNDGSSELYDMRSDPNEFTNLADRQSHAAQRKQLDQLLNQLIKQHALAGGQKATTKR